MAMTSPQPHGLLFIQVAWLKEHIHTSSQVVDSQLWLLIVMKDPFGPAYFCIALDGCYVD
jgi:hypothetical protein